MQGNKNISPLKAKGHIPGALCKTGLESASAICLDSASTIGFDEPTSAIGFESASIFETPPSASTGTGLVCFTPGFDSGSTKDRHIIPHLTQHVRIDG